MRLPRLSLFWIFAAIIPIIIAIIFTTTISSLYKSEEPATEDYGINLKIINNQIILNDSISLYKFIAVNGGDFSFKFKFTQSDSSFSGKITVPSMLIGETEIPCHLWNLVMFPAQTMQDYKQGFGQLPPSFTLCDILQLFYNKPVIATLDEWQIFVERLSKITNRKFAIPHIFEWYYAAQDGGLSNYRYSGSNSIDDVGWYLDNSSKVGATEFIDSGFNFYNIDVRSKAPNKLGIYGMSGGTQEFVIYSRNPNLTTLNPDKQNKSLIGVAGGSCEMSDEECRTDIVNLDYLYFNPKEPNGLRLILEN